MRVGFPEVVYYNSRYASYWNASCSIISSFQVEADPDKTTSNSGLLLRALFYGTSDRYITLFISFYQKSEILG